MRCVTRLPSLNMSVCCLLSDRGITKNLPMAAVGRHRHISVTSALTESNVEENARRTKPTIVKSQSSLQYCMQSVKKADYENYLCCLLLPKDLRTTAFAIRAFNVELAQIRDITTDKIIAQMRFQFWKDSLDKIFSGSPPASPIAQEVYRAVQKGHLSRLWFKRLIDARLDSLHDKPFPTIDAIESYSENAVSPVFYLLLEASNVKDVQADHAASHVGKAVGLTTLVRSVPILVAKGQVTLPMDLLMKHNLSTETVSRIGRGVETRFGVPVTEKDVCALKEVVFELASQANFHVEKARSIFATVPQSSLAIYLPIVSCGAFLDRLRKVDFDVFDSRLRQRDGLIAFKLWWKLKKKSI